MDQDPQTPRERAVLLLRAALLPRWRLTAGQGLIWVVRGTVVLVVFGLIASAVASAVDKPLWAWLNLLIIPVVLAIGGYWFTSSQNRATQAAAERRAQDDALQSYLNQMGQLLLDKDSQLLHPEEGDDARTLARAWTLTVLPRLDGLRKRSVVQFLYESGLITKDHVVIDLTGAHLAKANLTEANLEEANLCGAYLARANLVKVNLRRAELSNAKLFGADLSLAKLNGANLSDAVLIGDKRSTLFQRISATDKYTLGGIGPKNADLGYADLSGANLTNAYASEKQLESAESLKGATMPNGRKYENWLRIKRHRDREHGENGGTS
jgi:hypothetical protein